MASLEEGLADMDERLASLEIGGPLTTNLSDAKYVSKEHDEVTNEWRPPHMIIGGWGRETDRETAEVELSAF